MGWGARLAALPGFVETARYAVETARYDRKGWEEPSQR